MTRSPQTYRTTSITSLPSIMPSSPSLPIFSDPKPFGSMHAVQDSVARSQKRQRCAENSFSDPPTPVGQHRAKRPGVLSSNPPDCSWDRLSKEKRK
ncbi:hypothetical protein I7I51_06081 [Histoplasma capsulatum]|uniref:Uncharacterized protein n=1 Tax=Ajellomyces capsulatus TaxID=5037 RepID=A0A8A1MH37_AJECA|nr:hypothetical protein I7I51_06081 [Histoplasma capsulatum]